MKIRDVLVDPPLVLAPMEGVTDLTFRRLVRTVGGCGLTYTEFIPAAGLAQEHRTALLAAQFDPDEHPIAIQVFGRDPHWLAEGARVAQDLGADIVDLNMGCPSKKVCAHSGGSSLLREPDLARDIVRRIRAAVTIPFTVKMRTGWDPQHKNGVEVATMCEEEGAEAVTVHWRTRMDAYGGERELDTIAAIKQKLSIPVIANGDIVDVESARHTLAYTGCDGLMIGRGAVRNPWVFREVGAALFGKAPVVVDLDEKERVLLRFFDDVRARSRTDEGALGRWKKVARYFTTGLPSGDEMQKDVLRAQTADEAITRVRTWFDRMRAEAA